MTLLSWTARRSLCFIQYIVFLGCGGAGSASPPPAPVVATPKAVEGAEQPAPPSAEAPREPAEEADMSWQALPCMSWAAPSAATRPARRASEKQTLAKQNLAKGSIYVQFDAQIAGVIVPRKHAKNPRLVLRLGYNLEPPIPDLAVDDGGISGTLSFNKKPFFTRIPWDAVFAMGDSDREMLKIWSEDMPEEIRCEAESD